MKCYLTLYMISNKKNLRLIYHELACKFLLKYKIIFLVSSGNCNDRQTRWFYNHQAQNCESFLYSGCGGNANHFLSEEACQSRCVIGACCHRKPLFKNRLVGYNLDNYDR